MGDDWQGIDPSWDETVEAAKYAAEHGLLGALPGRYGRCAFDIIAEAHHLTETLPDEEPNAYTDDDDIDYEGVWLA
jgi:hypothetical protein